MLNKILILFGFGTGIVGFAVAGYMMLKDMRKNLYKGIKKGSLK